MPNGDGTGPFGDGPLGGRCYGFGRRFRGRNLGETGVYARRYGIGRGRGGPGRGQGMLYAQRNAESNFEMQEKADERFSRLEKLLQSILEKIESLNK